jgi:hypothetical protein
MAFFDNMLNFFEVDHWMQRYIYLSFSLRII